MCKWLVKCEVITQHLELIYTFSQSLYLCINFTHLTHFFHTVTKVSCPKLALGISNWPSGKKKKMSRLSISFKAPHGLFWLSDLIFTISWSSSHSLSLLPVALDKLNWVSQVGSISLSIGNILFPLLEHLPRTSSHVPSQITPVHLSWLIWETPLLQTLL